MLRFVVIVLLLACLAACLNWYVARWLGQAFSLSRRATWAIAAGLLSSLFLFVFARLFSMQDIEAPVRHLMALGGVIQLAVLLTSLLLMAADLGLVLVRAGRSVQLSSRTVAATPQPPASTTLTLQGEPDAISRRGFIGKAAASSSLLIASSSSLYGALIGRQDYRIEEQPIALPGLRRALDGFTIVQLSDLHVGTFVGAAELQAAREHVRLARPDLIVLTGDLIDNDARYADQLGEFAASLAPLARHGVVAISGNHDFYAGVRPTVAALERGGARVLRNRGLRIGDAGAGFALLGVDDVMGPRFGGKGPDLERALQTLRPAERELPRVLLCHNPVYFEEAAGRVGLQLSGHTHGGQINLGVSPAPWVLGHTWIAGRYDHAGSQLYVNRGFGTVGPPVRLGAPPEITRLVLTV